MDILSICPEGGELEILHEQHYQALRELWSTAGPGNSRPRALSLLPGGLSQQGLAQRHAEWEKSHAAPASDPLKVFF